jgi:hypothetical protein
MARITKKLNPIPSSQPVAEEQQQQPIAEQQSQQPPQPQPEQQQQQEAEASPFDSMLDSEYNRILDEQISKALSKMQERFGRMMVQEQGLGDKPKDRLGYNTDDYENMIKQIRARDLNEGSSREEVYQQLYNLKFTEMRKLDLIKQEFRR